MIQTIIIIAALMLAGGDVARARDTKRFVAPIYPDQARTARIQGTVKLEAEVDRTGRVIHVRAEGHPMLRRASEEALRQWQFAPAESHSFEEITVKFQLDSCEQNKAKLDAGNLNHGTRVSGELPSLLEISSDAPCFEALK